MPPHGTKDRRVARTRQGLRDALAALIAQKPYETIAVKEILHRANVGRSTFYSHFRDKDDLLLDSLHALLAPAATAPGATAEQPAERLVAFSRPVLEILSRHRPTAGDDAHGGERWRVVHGHLQEALAARVAEGLSAEFRRAGRASAAAEVDLLARHVAATFVLVVDWWVARGRDLAPGDADERFRALVLPALAGALG